MSNDHHSTLLRQRLQEYSIYLHGCAWSVYTQQWATSCSSKVDYRTNCWETWDHTEWLGRIFPRNSADGEMIVWNLSRELDYQIILPCKGASYWEGHGYWNWYKQSLSLQAPMLPLHFLVLLCFWSRISTLDLESGSPCVLMCSTGPLYLWQNQWSAISSGLPTIPTLKSSHVACFLWKTSTSAHFPWSYTSIVSSVLLLCCVYTLSLVNQMYVFIPIFSIAGMI